MQPPVRIGARASKLSQAQSRMMQRAIAATLGARPDAADEVCPMVLLTTAGDRLQDGRLIESGGKGLFTKEIEQALFDNRIDVAVHSLKDVPGAMPEGLVMAAIPKREDSRDAFVSKHWASLEELPEGARLGTASLRRQAQSLAARPDLRVEVLRGNVDTRLRRLEDGDFDAILLAAAGLNRLGRSDVIRSCIDPRKNPPAPGQGALLLQIREEDRRRYAGDDGRGWLSELDDEETSICVTAERGALMVLEGSCRTAIGAHAWVEPSIFRAEEVLHLIVEGLSADGSQRWRVEKSAPIDRGPPGEPWAGDLQAAAYYLGEAAGKEVRRMAGDRLVIA